MALATRIDKMIEQLDRIEAKLDGTWTEPEAKQEVPRPPSLDPADVASRLNYDTYSAAEIIERADSLSKVERLALADYETAHANRVTVLRALKGEK